MLCLTSAAAIFYQVVEMATTDNLFLKSVTFLSNNYLFVIQCRLLKGCQAELVEAGLIKKKQHSSQPAFDIRPMAETAS